MLNCASSLSVHIRLAPGQRKKLEAGLADAHYARFMATLGPQLYQDGIEQFRLQVGDVAM